MYELHEELEKLCRRITKEIHDLNKRLENNENVMSAPDVDVADKLSHTIKSIKKTMEMLDENQNRGYSGSFMTQPVWDRNYGYSGNNYRGTYTVSTGDGYSGRRMSRYSRDGEKTDMIRRLEDMLSRTHDPREMDAIRDTIDAINRE